MNDGEFATHHFLAVLFARGEFVYTAVIFAAWSGRAGLLFRTNFIGATLRNLLGSNDEVFTSASSSSIIISMVLHIPVIYWTCDVYPVAVLMCLDIATKVNERP